jgi:hypothetical protein
MLKIFERYLMSIKLLIWLKTRLAKFMQRTNIVLLYYADRQRKEVFSFIIKVQEETKMLLNNIEAYQIYMAVKNTSHIRGDIAEVGVYRGGSAKIICKANNNIRNLHLFDTFSGLPQVSSIDGYFREGQYSETSLESVKNYLKDYENVYYYKGIFPDSSKEVSNKIFSFVNLDTDIYDSTMNSLKFFYPRMRPGGIIMSHDYIATYPNIVEGVKLAFEEYFISKKEPIIEMAGSQCLVVKI